MYTPHKLRDCYDIIKVYGIKGENVKKNISYVLKRMKVKKVTYKSFFFSGSMLVEAMVALLVMSISLMIVGVSAAPLFKYSNEIQMEMDMIDIALSEAEKILNTSSVPDTATETINNRTYSITFGLSSDYALIKDLAESTETNIEFKYFDITVEPSSTDYSKSIKLKVVPVN